MAALAKGRPSVYSEAVAIEICERLADGESLRQICQSEHLPGRNTVLAWLQDDSKPGFRAKYARARQMQADFMDDKILEVAEKAERGEIDPHAARVAIGAYQWRASKLRPDVYGDRAAIDFKFSGSTREMTPEQVVVLENEMIEIACQGDPAKIEAFRRELDAGPVVIDGTAEVVHDTSDVPESE